MSDIDPHADTAPGAPPVGGKDPLIGQVIAGKYAVEAMVAKGGMGRIYRAEQRPLGRTVALKVLSLPNLDEQDPEFRSRFFLEASTLGRLSHPNTVTVFDYGYVEALDLYYIVMEFVAGRTLSSILKAEGALAPGRALRFADEIARALAEAHAQGIIHRDLKPGNVIVGQSAEGERVKVLDFGIAKVLEDDSDHVTRADQIIGSPRYMAPEQIRHDAVDPRLDQYSLGVMIFEMIAGEPPFKEASSVRTLMAHLSQPPPSLKATAAQAVPDSLDALVARCLCKEPEGRYEDIHAFRAATQACMEELGLTPAAITGGRVSAIVSPEGEDAVSQATLAGAPPEERRRLSPALLIALGLLFVLSFGVTLLGASALLEEEEEATVEAPPAPVDPPPVAAPVQLSIVSDPPGAEITENGTSLGKTPLTLELGPAGAAAAERQFDLSLAGYEGVRFTQGPVDADVSRRFTLQPTTPPPKTGGSAAPKTGNPSGPASGSKTTPPPDDGFRTRR